VAAASEQFRGAVTLAGEAPLIYSGQAPLPLASAEPRGPRRPVKQSLAQLVRGNRPHKRSPTTGHKLHKEGLALGDIQATKHGLLGLLEPGWELCNQPNSPYVSLFCFYCSHFQVLQLLFFHTINNFFWTWLTYGQP
jgi:hypothetical protein